MVKLWFKLLGDHNDDALSLTVVPPSEDETLDDIDVSDLLTQHLPTLFDVGGRVPSLLRLHCPKPPTDLPAATPAEAAGDDGDAAAASSPLPEVATEAVLSTHYVRLSNRASVAEIVAQLPTRRSIIVLELMDPAPPTPLPQQLLAFTPFESPVGGAAAAGGSAHVGGPSSTGDLHSGGSRQGSALRPGGTSSQQFGRSSTATATAGRANIGSAAMGTSVRTSTGAGGRASAATATATRERSAVGSEGSARPQRTTVATSGAGSSSSRTAATPTSMSFGTGGTTPRTHKAAATVPTAPHKAASSPNRSSRLGASASSSSPIVAGRERREKERSTSAAVVDAPNSDLALAARAGMLPPLASSHSDVADHHSTTTAHDNNNISTFANSHHSSSAAVAAVPVTPTKQQFAANASAAADDSMLRPPPPPRTPNAADAADAGALPSDEVEGGTPQKNDDDDNAHHGEAAVGSLRRHSSAGGAADHYLGSFVEAATEEGSRPVSPTMSEGPEGSPRRQSTAASSVASHLPRSASNVSGSAAGGGAVRDDRESSGGGGGGPSEEAGSNATTPMAAVAVATAKDGGGGGGLRGRTSRADRSTEPNPSALGASASASVSTTTTARRSTKSPAPSKPPASARQAAPHASETNTSASIANTTSSRMGASLGSSRRVAGSSTAAPVRDRMERSATATTSSRAIATAATAPPTTSTATATAVGGTATRIHISQQHLDTVCDTYRPNFGKKTCANCNHAELAHQLKAKERRRQKAEAAAARAAAIANGEVPPAEAEGLPPASQPEAAATSSGRNNRSVSAPRRASASSPAPAPSPQQQRSSSRGHNPFHGYGAVPRVAGLSTGTTAASPSAALRSRSASASAVAAGAVERTDSASSLARSVAATNRSARAMVSSVPSRSASASSMGTRDREGSAVGASSPVPARRAGALRTPVKGTPSADNSVLTPLARPPLSASTPRGASPLTRTATNTAGGGSSAGRTRGGASSASPLRTATPTKGAAASTTSRPPIGRPVTPRLAASASASTSVRPSASKSGADASSPSPTRRKRAVVASTSPSAAAPSSSASPTTVATAASSNEGSPLDPPPLLSSSGGSAPNPFAEGVGPTVESLASTGAEWDMGTVASSSADPSPRHSGTAAGAPPLVVVEAPSADSSDAFGGGVAAQRRSRPQSYAAGMGLPPTANGGGRSGGGGGALYSASVSLATPPLSARRVNSCLQRHIDTRASRQASPSVGRHRSPPRDGDVVSISGGLSPERAGGAFGYIAADGADGAPSSFVVGEGGGLRTVPSSASRAPSFDPHAATLVGIGGASPTHHSASQQQQYGNMPTPPASGVGGGSDSAHLQALVAEGAMDASAAAALLLNMPAPLSPGEEAALADKARLLNSTNVRSASLNASPMLNADDGAASAGTPRPVLLALGRGGGSAHVGGARSPSAAAHTDPVSPLGHAEAFADTLRCGGSTFFDSPLGSPDQYIRGGDRHSARHAAGGDGEKGALSPAVDGGLCFAAAVTSHTNVSAAATEEAFGPQLTSEDCPSPLVGIAPAVCTSPTKSLTSSASSPRGGFIRHSSRSGLRNAGSITELDAMPPSASTVAQQQQQREERAEEDDGVASSLLEGTGRSDGCGEEGEEGSAPKRGDGANGSGASLNSHGSATSTDIAALHEQELAVLDAEARRLGEEAAAAARLARDALAGSNNSLIRLRSRRSSLAATPTAPEKASANRVEEKDEKEEVDASPSEATVSVAPKVLSSSEHAVERSAKAEGTAAVVCDGDADDAKHIDSTTDAVEAGASNANTNDDADDDDDDDPFGTLYEDAEDKKGATEATVDDKGKGKDVEAPIDSAAAAAAVAALSAEDAAAIAAAVAGARECSIEGLTDLGDPFAAAQPPIASEEEQPTSAADADEKERGGAATPLRQHDDDANSSVAIAPNDANAAMAMLSPDARAVCDDDLLATAVAMSIAREGEGVAVTAAADPQKTLFCEDAKEGTVATTAPTADGAHSNTAATAHGLSRPPMHCGTPTPTSTPLLPPTSAPSSSSDAAIGGGRAAALASRTNSGARLRTASNASRRSSSASRMAWGAATEHVRSSSRTDCFSSPAPSEEARRAAASVSEVEVKGSGVAVAPSSEHNEGAAALASASAECDGGDSDSSTSAAQREERTAALIAALNAAASASSGADEAAEAPVGAFSAAADKNTTAEEVSPEMCIPFAGAERPAPLDADQLLTSNSANAADSASSQAVAAAVEEKHCVAASPPSPKPAAPLPQQATADGEVENTCMKAEGGASSTAYAPMSPLRMAPESVSVSAPRPDEEEGADAAVEAGRGVFNSTPPAALENPEEFFQEF